jgi:catechol 2,3-dioxygenase-like lactoylglutathione lyase family enzyme
MPIKVLELQHLNVRLQTPEQARDFYGRLLGLEQDPRMPYSEERALMWWNVGQDRQIHTPIGPRINQTPSGRPIVRHFALRVEDIEDAKRVLAQEGIPFDEQVLPGRTARQIFVNDPAGNLVELFQD